MEQAVADFIEKYGDRVCIFQGTCYRCDRGFDSYISDLSDYCMD